ncbi:MAG TPA: response regulator [Tepidisphaeraceae bacterium]|nr:response regulator [Tepidisphaeraceae bacterium]
MKLNPQILIVEDEPRMRDLLLRAISSWGHKTAAARSGEEALRMIEKDPPHILLLDLNLPAMSGLDVLEKVHQSHPATQVIILTGFGDLDAAKKAIHLDVVEFLTKPAHLGQLEQALDRARKRLEESPTVTPIPSPPPMTPPDLPPATTLDEVEREHILAALARNSGNRSATATELGISLRTLYYRLNEYQKQGLHID